MSDENIPHGAFVRVSLTLKPEYVQRMLKMKKNSGVKSFPEVIRNSLREYEKILEFVGDEEGYFIETLSGRRIYITR